MHDLLQRFVDFLQPLALQLGGPGLAIIAFFDSSFLSLPEVSDVLIVVLTIQHPARWLYYAAMTTLGSVCGCYALYALARKGGEAALRRRFFTVSCVSSLESPGRSRPFSRRIITSRMTSGS